MTDAPGPKPTGVEWVAMLAVHLGVTPPDDETVEDLLALASVAAHSSERLAAPLACWLVGRAGAEPADVLDQLRRLGSEG